VDDEVWEWLKSQAQPLEDTPNSVLRRVAGIDPPLAGVPRAAPRPISLPMGAPPRGGAGAPPARDTPNATGRERQSTPKPPAAPKPAHASAPAARPAKRVTGEWLNRAFNLEARHSLYHKDGTFYERLVAFPGVLCDPKGFVRYEDEEQFVGDPQLSIGEKVNIPRSLSAHPRYSRFPTLAKE
jgi:hypothetical protein